MSRLLTALIVGAAVLGPASAAPFPKDGEPSLYFPTTVGTKWVVRHGDGVGFGDVTYTVTGVEEKDGAKLVTVSEAYTIKWHEITVAVGQEGVPRVEVVDRPGGRYRVSAEGVFRVAKYDAEKKGLVDLEEPWRVFRLPAKPGDREEGKDGGYRWISTVGKPERMKVAAGTFEAIPVYVDGTVDREEVPRRTFWYAPGVGLVKSDLGDRPGAELISFTPAKK